MAGLDLDFNSAPVQGAEQVIPEWAAEQPRYDAQEVKRAMLANLEGILGHLFPNGFAERSGRVFYIGSTSGEAGESLNVTLTGDKAGLWYDFATGEGGDILDLWRLARGHTQFADAVKDAAEYSGAVAEVPRKVPRRRGSAKTCDGHPTATYDYRDRQGQLIAQVDRFEWSGEDGRRRKAFRPWDVSRRTHRAPEPRPLYNLPGIAGAPEVIFVEGEKCVEALKAVGIPATCAMGGSNAPTDKTDWMPLAGLKVTIWPDNDDTGRKYAHAVAEALRAVRAHPEILTLPPSRPEKWDAADAIADGEDPAALIREMRGGPQEKPAAAIELEPWGSLEDVPVQWLVDEIIPQESMAALYGRPGSYKSFVAFYLAAMVATGGQAFGKDTVQAPVVYVMGEGGAGAKRRAEALEQTYGIHNPPVAFLRRPLDLRSGPADALALVQAIEAMEMRPALLVIDTLARNFGGGNENSSEDMGAFISMVDNVRHHLRCAVLIVHHSGKDEARGMRGHSMLLGAVDAELEVVKVTDDETGEARRIGEMRVTKQKDGEDGWSMQYEMRTVILGADRSSLALVPLSEQERVRQKARLTANEQAIFDDIRRFAELDNFRELTVNKSGRTVAVRGATQEEIRAFVMGSALQSVAVEATRRSKWARGIEGLINKGILGAYGEILWIE